MCGQYQHKLQGGELSAAVKLMNVSTGWGWEYFDQAVTGSQKNTEQVVQRPRFKSHSCHVWGVWLLANQFTSVFTCKMEKIIPALPPPEDCFQNQMR